MPLDIATIGRTQSAAIGAADGHITLGDNFAAAWVFSSVAGHVTVDGSTADQTSLPILANERLALTVQPGSAANAEGGGAVHFIKDTAASAGTIWVTEVC